MGRVGQAVSGGFSDVRLETDRFRVTFAGNSLTSRETVERYLLYRAAELTVAQGADWFSVVERQTDRKARTYVDAQGLTQGEVLAGGSVTLRDQSSATGETVHHDQDHDACRRCLGARAAG